MKTENVIETTLYVLCACLFAAAASSAHSAERDSVYLETCRADVEKHYSEQRDLTFVNEAQRHGRRSADAICKERQQQRRIRQLLGTPRPQPY